MSIVDFHECGFAILASDFFRGCLRRYGVQLQYLPPNTVLQLAGFILVCEAFLGIAPNKDLFWKVFEVVTYKAHGSDCSVLAPMGGMKLQTR